MGEPDCDDRSQPAPQVKLVAEADLGAGRERPFFKSAQWSADGTTVIASTSANAVLSYVLPADLLEPSAGTTHRLAPQGRLALPEPASALTPAPYFSLAEPASQSVLVACRDLPIQLHALFPPEDDDVAQRPAPLAAYPLIKTETEAFLTPTALLWDAPGTHFVAGTTNLLALFDASRTAQAPPVLRVPTIPSTRHLRKGNGVGMRGTVSALSRSISSGLVAAGTWTRWVGLYDLARAGGQCAATWSVADAAAGKIGGGGILQTLWSPCGRYLVVNERRSRGLLVYDIRGSGELLCCLTGRPAETNQRLSCDVYMSASADAGSGFEVWAGTQDGKAVVWEGVGQKEGTVEPSWDWTAHGSAMGSTAMHSSGSIVATCSGSWVLPSDHGSDSSSDGSEDSDDTDSTGDSDDSDNASSSDDSSSKDSSHSSTDGLCTSIDASLKIWKVI